MVSARTWVASARRSVAGAILQAERTSPAPDNRWARSRQDGTTRRRDVGLLNGDGHPNGKRPAEAARRLRPIPRSSSVRRRAGAVRDRDERSAHDRPRSRDPDGGVVRPEAQGSPATPRPGRTLRRARGHERVRARRGSVYRSVQAMPCSCRQVCPTASRTSATTSSPGSCAGTRWAARPASPARRTPTTTGSRRGSRTSHGRTGLTRAGLARGCPPVAGPVSPSRLVLTSLAVIGSAPTSTTSPDA